MNYPRIAAQIFGKPLMVEPNYAKVFTSALTDYIGLRSLQDIDGKRLNADQMRALANGHQRSEQKQHAQVDDIAIISVQGTLTHRASNLDAESGIVGYNQIQRQLESAMADESVKGMMLDANSPGGSVAGCFDLAAQIADFAQTKPIWAVVDEMACSACYALVSGATKIVAPQTAQIGSIGVLTMHVDQSKALANEGLDVQFIFAGAHKVDGNSFEPLADDVQADIQADINQVYGLFVDLVAKNRGISSEAVRNTEARVYNADDAVNLGLADAVMPAHAALAEFDRALNPPTFTTGAKTMALSFFGRTPKADTPPEPAEIATADRVAQLEAGGFEVRLDEDGQIAGIGSPPDADAPVAASTDELVALCAEARCNNLVAPLKARGVTAEQAQAIVADAGDIRDAFATALPADAKAAAEMADTFIHAAHVEQRFGGAARALLVDLTADRSAPEIDHHPPQGPAAGKARLNAATFHQP